MKTLHTIFATTCFIFSINSMAIELQSGYKNLTIEFSEVQIPSCNGQSNGSVTAIVSGGKAPYEYSWNTYPEQTTPKAVNLKSGIYFIEVTDANGQVFFNSVEISDPVQTTNVDNGAVTSTDFEITVSENVESYSVFVDGVIVTDDVIHGLDVGIHKLVISSSTCTVMQFIQVMEYQNPQENPDLVIESTPLHSIEKMEEENYNVNLSLNHE